MFTFHNLFNACAGLCIMALILSLWGEPAPGAYPDLYVGVFWTVLTVVFLCAANACRPKKDAKGRRLKAYRKRRREGMDKNLVVSLDEIKGIRLQCKKCGSEGMVSPTNPYLHGPTCPQGHPWQEKPLSQNDNIYMFLGALRKLIESPAPFKAVRLEIDGGQVEEPDAEGHNE